MVRKRNFTRKKREREKNFPEIKKQEIDKWKVSLSQLVIFLSVSFFENLFLSFL